LPPVLSTTLFRSRADVKPLRGKRPKLGPGHRPTFPRGRGRDVHAARVGDGSQEIVPLGDGDRLGVLPPALLQSPPVLLVSNAKNAGGAAVFEDDGTAGRVLEDE